MAADRGGRVAVLAGAAPGLGASIAEALVRAGYGVAGLSRGDRFGKRLEGELDGYRHFVCDVTDATRVAETLSAIERDLGTPSVLVYDPMKLVVKPFDELSPEEFESVWRVTCFGAMIVARAMLPYVRKAGGGTIIFTGATAAVKGGPRFASLASAKFALRGLAQSLARELGPEGVHVVHVVLDGLVWSPQTRERFDPEREKCLEPTAIAETYVDLLSQHPSAWTHEIDLRPMHEKFSAVEYHVPERLHHDPREPVIVEASTLPWTPSPTAGVERRFLEREGGEIARATSIVRYARASSFPGHVHEKGEEFLVLVGIFSDEHGDFGEGTYVRNPPGSRHVPFTRDGCVIFVKLRQMPPTEKDAVVVDTKRASAVATNVEGLSRLELHRCDRGEQVAIEILESGAEWRNRGTLGGEEILVIEGTLRYGDRVCGPETWLRFPPGQERALSSPAGCRLWTKRGHLGSASASR